GPHRRDQDVLEHFPAAGARGPLALAASGCSRRPVGLRLARKCPEIALAPVGAAEAVPKPRPWPSRPIRDPDPTRSALASESYRTHAESGRSGDLETRRVRGCQIGDSYCV